jgi:hypothetical protein
VYNRYVNPVTKLDEYKRTYLYGANWNDSKGVNVLKSGMSDADSAIIQVPFTVECDKTYKPPKEWAATPNVDMPKYWTLQKGDKIAKGIINYDIPPGTIAQLEKQFDSVITITSVDVIDSGSLSIRNYRVGGK